MRSSAPVKTRAHVTEADHDSVGPWPAAIQLMLQRPLCFDRSDAYSELFL